MLQLQEHPDMWTRVDGILETSTNPNSKFLALQARGPRAGAGAAAARGAASCCGACAGAARGAARARPAARLALLGAPLRCSVAHRAPRPLRPRRRAARVRNASWATRAAQRRRSRASDAPRRVRACQP
jgi:hypothetical protein